MNINNGLSTSPELIETFIQLQRSERKDLPLSPIVGVVLADNETAFVPTSRLLINPSQDTKKEKIENKSEVELFKIRVEEAQYKTCIIKIFKHTNRLTHLYLSIRLRINCFPSSPRATTREIPPSSFVEDSHRETTTPPPRDYDVSLRTATERTQIANIAFEQRESARKKEKKKMTESKRHLSSLQLLCDTWQLKDVPSFS